LLALELHLPTLNAILNGTSAVLIVIARQLIRQRRERAHRNVMLAAVGTSTAFLVSYLIYHYSAGSVRFTGTGWVRGLYFAILISHTILAVAIVPLVIASLLSGLRYRRVRHRAIVKWAYPIWLYVSVTGVVIYLMLYQLRF
jgi:uncharacterized membrane protein YozB (DUF420 family)